MAVIVAVAVVVGMWVFWRANVFHFVDVAAFRAALDGALTGNL